MQARHHKVLKAAKRAKHSGTVTDFHGLRIRCKRLRYALEFSSEVYGGQTSRFVRQLTALQDELGVMQDAEVASLQLADLATADTHLPAATIFVMGGVAERHRREVERLPQTTARRAAPDRGTGLARPARPHGAAPAEAEAARPPVRPSLRARAPGRRPGPCRQDVAAGQVAPPIAGP